MTNRKITKPPRDYRAEYTRRVERGLAKGLSRSQARGHPKAQEQNVRIPRPINDDDFQISLRELRSGKTLREVARLIHVSPERLRNQAAIRGAIIRQGRRWVVRDDLPRRMLIYSRGESFAITVGDFAEASMVGRYMAAVSKFLETNDPKPLEAFTKQSVRDRKGNTHLRPIPTFSIASHRVAGSHLNKFTASLFNKESKS